MASQNAQQQKPGAAVLKYVRQLAEKHIKKLPKLVKDSVTGLKRLQQPLSQDTHPNFIYPIPNPTIHFDPLRKEITSLSVEAFHAMQSNLVLWAPAIFWPTLAVVKCPLCSQPASPLGWSTSMRRICGLHTNWYVVGQRHICRNCSGELHSA